MEKTSRLDTSKLDKSRLGHSMMGFSSSFQKQLPDRLSTILSLIKQGHLPLLHQFLRKDEQKEVDSHQKNLLFHACYNNQPSILLYLILRDVPINHIDGQQRNLFHVCGYTGSLACFDVLLQRLACLRKAEALTELRRLHTQHNIRKADYSDGKLIQPATSSKQQRFERFYKEAEALYEKYLQTEFDDYVTALSLQDATSKRTPLHLASLSRYQRCYQTLKRMAKQQPNEDEGFKQYVRMWSEVCNFVRVEFPDPRVTDEIDKELEDAVGSKLAQKLHDRFKKQFEKELRRILCLQDKNGQTAIHIASENGHASIVGLLLKVGADAKHIDQKSKSKKIIECAINDPTRRQITDLCKASETGNKNDINLLINCGQQVNHKQTIYGLTPLLNSVVYSSDNGNLESVNLLLDSGADVDIQDVNGWTSLHKACQKGNLELVGLLLSRRSNHMKKSNKGYTALHIAALNDHQKIVQQLLKIKNIDVNSPDQQGCTPLHLASKKGAKNAVEKLLNHPECDLYSVDKKKWTALHYATFSEHASTVSLLLKYDADNDRLRFMQNCQGKVAKQLSNNSDVRGAYITIWRAASEGKLDDMRKLLANGADKDAPSNRLKRTPLILAVINCHPLMVKFLLDQGADTYFQDNSGKTAESHAKELAQSSTLDKSKRTDAARILKLLSS